MRLIIGLQRSTDGSNTPMKLLTQTIQVFCLIMVTGWGYAMPTLTETILVFDALSRKDNPPKNFRCPNWQADSFHNLAPFLLEGLDEMQALASGQFSESELKVLLQKIPAKKLWVVDLRHESHGFVNGQAISWYGYRNLDNQHLTVEELTQTEHQQVHALAGKEVEIGHIVKKIGGEIQDYTLNKTNAKSVETEQELVQRLGAHYYRLPVLDRHPPNNATVEKFIKWVEALPSDQWLYFHCRAGKGRTTTFMVLFDILRNGHRLDLDEILDRQAYYGPKDLRKLPHKAENLWKLEPAKQRLALIQALYQYRNSPQYRAVSWTQWRHQHG